MAYDEELADRIRASLGGRRGVTEKKVFGGIAFLVRGNMAIAASGEGGLLVRADPARGEKLVAAGKAEPMRMRGREMTGWLRVSADDARTARQLATWVEIGTTAAGSLPPKK